MKITKTLSILILLSGLVALIPDTVKAQPKGEGGNLGIGIMAGEPTGISVKSWTNDRTALDLGVSWSLESNSSFHLHADYLLHKWLQEAESETLAFYYGIGARFAVREPDPKIGVRVPLGLNFIIPDTPIDLFVEAVPIFDILPEPAFSGNGALGVRYYF